MAVRRRGTPPGSRRTPLQPPHDDQNASPNQPAASHQACHRSRRTLGHGPIKKVAQSIRAHQDLILNWLPAQKESPCGIVQGLNYKIKLTIRKAYGFKTLEAERIALYHALRRLPEPELTHEFR